MTPKSNKFVLNPDAYVSDQITMNRFLNYCKENVKKEESLKFEDIIRCQKYQLKQPILKNYPLKQYPTAFKESFNCLLKIGSHKRTSKTEFDLLNIMAKIITDSYKKQAEMVEDIFEDEPVMPSDYSSHHNIIKDEIFIQFIKQIMGNNF